jgi:uncharacterized protein YihD (DUF1040 family)
MKTVHEQEDLLEGSIEYEGSFAQMVDYLEPKESNRVKFHYLNPAIGFYGREQEIEQLDAFLDDERKLGFGAIVGSGGAGKSKFVYSYVNARIDPSWKAVYLSRATIERMLNYPHWKYPQNLLFIIDYAGETAEKTGELLCEMRSRMANGLQEKVRFLLIERQGMARDMFGMNIEPNWFDHLLKSGERRNNLRKLLYHFGLEEPFLKLPPLGENELWEMAEDYAHSQNVHINDDDWQALYAFAQQLERSSDSEYCAVRPLIVLFITDALIHEPRSEQKTHKEPFRNWDFDQVMEHVIKRYEKNWRESLCEGDKELYESLCYLLLYATVIGGLSLDDKSARPDILESHLDRLFHGDEKKWQSLICGLNNADNYRGVLEALEPDLIGEYFVLARLKDLYRTKKGKELIAALWEQPETLFFFDRCRLDFVGKGTAFEALFENGARALIPPEAQQRHSLLIAMFLTTLATSQELPAAFTTVERLAEIHTAHEKNAEIALMYAMGLFNLSLKQASEDAEQSVAKLERLCRSYEGDAGIALAYAGGLAILSNKQEPEDAARSAEELEGLHRLYEESAEIALMYANGLFRFLSLFLNQEVGDVERSVEKLEGLHRLYEENADIALTYARGLVSLSSKQEVGDVGRSVEKLEGLYRLYEENAEIMLMYAKGLVNLSVRQGSEDAERTVATLEGLYHSHEGNADIVLAYATGLFNLSSNQSPEDAARSVERLDGLYRLYEDNTEIALVYAWGLARLSFDQDAEDIDRTVERLDGLHHSHEGNAGIALVYAGGLAILSNMQEAEDAERTVEKLEELHHSHEGNAGIALRYAMGLFNLSNKQEEKDAKQTVEKLEGLYRLYEENAEIALRCAWGLVNLSRDQGLEDTARSVEALKGLHHSYEENVEIALEYAMGLVNLSAKQGLENAKQTIERLEGLYRSYEKNAEIAQMYARGLVNLSLDQGPEDAGRTIEKFKNVIAQHKEAPEFREFIELFKQNGFSF